ncbi:calcium-binding protein [Siphonobacter sp. SORGH_AS_0500]|uniref:c-type cytochrome n=1 Tax=Siphonobacter sp. SORGH_AS_0500 TaxID=1864824 RepID=UPI000CAEE990|nr:cytochrome c [Siphonobacter sp. SORGH_AS_0500]PKK38248.1 calcium-binding protein [Siphonobacter sp. SORGH_AS_0500]
MKKVLLCLVLQWCLLTGTNGQSFQDVEPIFLQKCATCHRSGDAAPFPLQTYEDIVKRISFIKKVITTGYMPPWQADAHYRSFANERRLSSQEKKMIVNWIEAKAPKGNYQKKSAQITRLLREQTAYHRSPDLTLQIDTTFHLVGDTKERFVVFQIPMDLPKDQAIEGVEFYTNNKKIIHHVNYGFYKVDDPSVDINQGAKVINTTDDPNTPSLLQQQKKLKQHMVYYTGWIPGTSVESYPKTFGWTLPKRGVILLTVHYSALAADEESIVGVNLFFQKTPIQRTVKVISLGSGGIGEKDITPPLLLLPGDRSKHHLQVQTKEDQSLLYVWPHMHYLGTSFTAYAVTPQQDTIPLVRIAKWDFRWQELYRFKELIKVPKGSVIHLDCSYDNTEDNPYNPNSPPATVFSFGDMDSKNEMMTLLLIYTPYKPGDEELDLENH